MGGASDTNFSTASFAITDITNDNQNTLAQKSLTEVINSTIQSTLQSQSNNIKAFVTQKNTIGGTGASNCPGGGSFKLKNVKMDNTIKIDNKAVSASDYKTDLQLKVQSDIASSLYASAANANSGAVSSMLSAITGQAAQATQAVAAAVAGTAAAIAGALDPISGSHNTNQSATSFDITKVSQKNNTDIRNDINTKVNTDQRTSDTNAVITEFFSNSLQTNEVNPNNYCNVDIDTLDMNNLVDVTSKMSTISTMSNNIASQIVNTITNQASAVATNMNSTGTGDAAAVLNQSVGAAIAGMMVTGTAAVNSVSILSTIFTPTNLMIIGGSVVALIVVIILIKMLTGGGRDDDDN